MPQFKSMTVSDIKHTTISLKNSTKGKLDKNRAPGQCYDGFICQLVDLCEKVKGERQGYILNPNKGR